MPQAPTTGKYKWLTTMCGALTNSLVPGSVCGRRQFKVDKHGETCKDGHGGADGIEMTRDEIVKWDKAYWDGEQPDDPDFEKPAGISDDEEPEAELPCVGPGDVGVVVQLKSGGPKLTVLVPPFAAKSVTKATRMDKKLSMADIERMQTSSQGQTCECVWFDQLGQLKRDVFVIATLKLVPISER